MSALLRPSDLAVSHHTVDLPHTRLHYVEAGEGPTVLLLHGFPEMWWSFRYQLEPLAAAGFRVIAPDLRGFGGSAKVGPFDIASVTLDVVDLLKATGHTRPVYVVGHDWGGGVAWHLAAFHPQWVKRLVAMNCPHPERMRKALLTQPVPRQVRMSWYFYFFQFPRAPEWLMLRDGASAVVRSIRGASVDRTNFSAEELEPFRASALQPGAISAMLAWYRSAVRDGVRQLFSARAVPRITQPTLVIWGLEDPALDYDSLVPGTEALVADLRIQPIAGCGHFVHAEQPVRVNALLADFLPR